MTRAAALILALILAATSCVEPAKPKPLPPPGPPVPAPPKAARKEPGLPAPPAPRAPSQGFAEAPPQAKPPPSAVVEALPSAVTQPIVSVLAFRAGDGRRIADAGLTAAFSSHLVRTRFPVRRIEAPSKLLPEGLLELAKAVAVEHARTSPQFPILIIGECREEAGAEVRAVAMDLRTMKEIDNFGNKGPGEELDAVLEKTVDEIAGAIRKYWK